MSYRKVIAALKPELIATGKRFEIVAGKRHNRILIEGRQVCVFSQDSDQYARGLKNLIGDIRRAGRGEFQRG